MARKPASVHVDQDHARRPTGAGGSIVPQDPVHEHGLDSLLALRTTRGCRTSTLHKHPGRLARRVPQTVAGRPSGGSVVVLPRRASRDGRAQIPDYGNFAASGLHPLQRAPDLRVVIAGTTTYLRWNRPSAHRSTPARTSVRCTGSASCAVEETAASSTTTRVTSPWATGEPVRSSVATSSKRSSRPSTCDEDGAAGHGRAHGRRGEVLERRPGSRRRRTRSGAAGRTASTVAASSQPSSRGVASTAKRPRSDRDAVSSVADDVRTSCAREPLAAARVGPCGRSSPPATCHLRQGGLAARWVRLRDLPGHTNRRRHHEQDRSQASRSPQEQGEPRQAPQHLTKLLTTLRTSAEEPPPTHGLRGFRACYSDVPGFAPEGAGVRLARSRAAPDGSRTSPAGEARPAPARCRSARSGP